MSTSSHSRIYNPQAETRHSIKVGIMNTDKNKRTNQHKPLRELLGSISALNLFFYSPLLPSFVAPEDDLLPVVKYYWSLGLSDEKIAEHSRDHFDLSTYGIRQARERQ